jgi:hypothetical protein
MKAAGPEGPAAFFRPLAEVYGCVLIDASAFALPFAFALAETGEAKFCG